MSESQHRLVRNGDMDAAGDGATSGLPREAGGIMAMLKAARDWGRRQSKKKFQAHFGWMTKAQKEKALASEKRKVESGKAETRIGFQSARRHLIESGVRKFRMKVQSEDPWEKL